MKTARQVLDRNMREEPFQQGIIDVAIQLGWKVYHPRVSWKSADGFPDLTLVKHRVVFWECKTMKGKPSDDQTDWLLTMDAIPGIEARVVTPCDWPYIERVLTERSPPHA